MTRMLGKRNSPRPGSRAASDAPPRILLIGANGQLGRELLKSLRSLGEITATVRTPDKDPAVCRCPIIDVTSASSIRGLIRSIRPTLVVNCSGYTDVDKAEQDFATAMAVNGVAPGIMAAEVARCGAAIVHFSSDYVFDGKGNRPWNEDDAPSPLNVYGQTKLAGEEAIRRSGAVHLILRISWLYGVHGRNFVKTMLRLSKSNAEIRVVDDQFGAPTSARVVAEVTGRILAQGRGDLSGLLDRSGGTLHLACAGHTSWHQFAEEVLRSARRQPTWPGGSRLVPVATRDFPSPARRPLNSRLDCTRLRDRFGIIQPFWKNVLTDEFSAIVLHTEAMLCPCESMDQRKGASMPATAISGQRCGSAGAVG